MSDIETSIGMITAAPDMPIRSKLELDLEQLREAIHSRHHLTEADLRIALLELLRMNIALATQVRILSMRY